MSRVRSTRHGAAHLTPSRLYLTMLARRLYARRLFSPMAGPGALNHSLATRITQLRRRS